MSSSDEDEPNAALILRNSVFTDNWAELQNAGVVNLGEYATVLVEGDGNVFARNECGEDGAVFGATVDTMVVVEGGEFYENDANDVGGGVVGSGCCCWWWCGRWWGWFGVVVVVVVNSN